LRHKTNLVKELTHLKIKNKKLDLSFNGLYIKLKVKKVIEGIDPYFGNQDQKGQQRDRRK
jgi:hypothetical protein